MSPVQIREAGDSAVVLRLGDVIDPAVNARVIAAAEAFRRKSLPGVRDVVSTFCSVAVYFDPLTLDVDTATQALAASVEAPVEQQDSRTIVIPVTYGEAMGPDLSEVAQIAGLSVEQVIARHSGRDYRVFMLGFLPGFPYMASVDESIVVPRHATPRVRVPAGSIGIAGRQTGIYPRDSPGGWRIIGRTAERLFDARQSRPSLLSPGDTVRFEPVSSLTARDVEATSSRTFERGDSERVATIVRAGLLTTVQDGGRWGHQSQGVSISGPMDRVSHRLANALVGNDPSAAALEITLLGPEVRFDSGAVVAVAGADLQPRLDGEVLPMHRPVRCPPGSVIRFGERRSGARAYLAFGGGVVLPPVLGSRSTHAVSGLGGVNGRAIATGDLLPLGPHGEAGHWHVVDAPSSRVSGGARLRVLPGPHQDCFPHEALDVLQRTRFIVTTQSDRMGYRLSGAQLPVLGRGEMISDATFTGALQVPPSGHPIMLMADRQTSGGYPQLATVITADLPLAGQLAPGDWVEFDVCSRHEAMSALFAQEGMLRALR